MSLHPGAAGAPGARQPELLPPPRGEPGSVPASPGRAGAAAAMISPGRAALLTCVVEAVQHGRLAEVQLAEVQGLQRGAHRLARLPQALQGAALRRQQRPLARLVDHVGDRGPPAATLGPRSGARAGGGGGVLSPESGGRRRGQVGREAAGAALGPGRSPAEHLLARGPAAGRAGHRQADVPLAAVAHPGGKGAAPGSVAPAGVRRMPYCAARPGAVPLSCWRGEAAGLKRRTPTRALAKADGEGETSTASLRACYRHHDAPLPSPPHLQGLPGAQTPGSPASFSCRPRHPALAPAASLLGRNSSAAGRNHLWDRSPAPQLQPSDSCGATGSAGWGGPSTGHLLRPRLRAQITFSAPSLSIPAASRVGVLEEGESRRVLMGLSAWKGAATLGKSRPGHPRSPGRPGRGRQCRLFERTEGGPSLPSPAGLYFVISSSLTRAHSRASNLWGQAAPPHRWNAGGPASPRSLQRCLRFTWRSLCLQEARSCALNLVLLKGFLSFTAFLVCF